jgi:hypothetical protein
MNGDLKQDEILKQCKVDLQMAVIKTLLNIMHDDANAARDRLKAAEMLSKISPTIFNESQGGKHEQR